MKRIVFLDYVRVFACFLVMVVHASENFYGAPGSTDMVGPQAFLANEADRLWVSMYDGFSRMAVPLFIIVSAFLLAPMKEGLTMWQFYRRRSIRILPPFFIFMILYSTLPMLWGQIDGATSIKDLSRIFLNFPTLAGHLWSFNQHLSVHPCCLALVEQGNGQRRTFLYRTVPTVDLYALPEPLVRGSVGTVLLERISYVVVFFRLLRLSRACTLYTCPSDLESLQTFHCRNRFDACWCGFDHLFVLCSGHTRRDSSHARTGNRVGFLYHQLCASHGRYVLDVQLY